MLEQEHHHQSESDVSQHQKRKAHNHRQSMPALILYAPLSVLDAAVAVVIAALSVIVLGRPVAPWILLFSLVLLVHIRLDFVGALVFAGIATRAVRPVVVELASERAILAVNSGVFAALLAQLDFVVDVSCFGRQSLILG